MLFLSRRQKIEHRKMIKIIKVFLADQPKLYHSSFEINTFFCLFVLSKSVNTASPSQQNVLSFLPAGFPILYLLLYAPLRYIQLGLSQYIRLWNTTVPYPFSNNAFAGNLEPQIWNHVNINCFRAMPKTTLPVNMRISIQISNRNCSKWKPIHWN